MGAGATCMTDQEFVFKALKVKGKMPWGLRYAGQGFILKAVEKFPHCLRYANAVCKGVEGIVRKAVMKSAACLQFASATCKGNREFILKLVEKVPDCFRYSSAACKCDRGFVLKAIERVPASLQYTIVRASCCSGAVCADGPESKLNAEDERPYYRFLYAGAARKTCDDHEPSRCRKVVARRTRHHRGSRAETPAGKKKECNAIQLASCRRHIAIERRLRNRLQDQKLAHGRRSKAYWQQMCLAND